MKISVDEQDFPKKSYRLSVPIKKKEEVYKHLYQHPSYLPYLHILCNTVIACLVILS